MTLVFDHPPTTDSLLSRLDPRWKLAALLLATAGAAALQSWPAAGVALLGALALAWLGRLPRRWFLGRLGTVVLFLTPFVVLLPFLSGDRRFDWQLGPVPVSPQGLELALLLILKALTIVTLMLILLATAPLPATLKAAHALHLPAVIVHLAVLTYRYLFVLADELARLRIALRVRGYRNRANLHSYRTIGHVAGTLLVRGYERGERVGQAMRCRGFDGHFRCLTEFRTTWKDVLLFLVVVSSTITLLVLDWCI